MPVTGSSDFRTAPEIVADLGQRIRDYRLSRRLKQETVANKAQVSVRALRNLEAGTGSNLETLVRVLRALGLDDNLGNLVPQPTVSPMAMLARKGAAARGSR